MRTLVLLFVLVLGVVLGSFDGQAQTYYNNVLPSITYRSVGRIDLLDGAYFEGNEKLSNGVKIGFSGLLHYADGGFYSGECDLYLRPHGRGQIAVPGGDVYNVCFENGQLISQSKFQNLLK
jgi:hypothetical protein